MVFISSIAIAQKKNVIVIMTDQQGVNMMSCTGNKWVNTPNLDKLASKGVRFENTSPTNPVCVPSRFSFQTGKYPSAIGMRHNDSKINRDAHDQIINDAMGNVFKRAGYDTYYGGKVHFPTSYDNASNYGYEMLTSDYRDELADKSAEFIKNRSKEDKPFLLFLSFMNPHDICYLGLREMLPGSWYDTHTPKPLLDLVDKKEIMVSDLKGELPPIPDNFGITEGEPTGNQELLKIRKYRQMLRENWTEDDWRFHKWAYAKLTERADSLIGVFLNGFYGSEVAENTVVIFTSDHGDLDGAHKLEHKSFFYEESIKVPMIVAGKDIKQGIVGEDVMINNGLDLLPTACDLAGINAPSHLEGESFAPLVEQGLEGKYSARKHLVIENQVGFMIMDGRYKYQKFDGSDGNGGDMLFDLQEDPGEMKNVVEDDKYKKLVKNMNRLLEKHTKKIKNDYSM